MPLPPARAQMLDILLEGVSRKDLAGRVEKLSAVYRGGGTSSVIAGPADALAYTVARAPATYAAAEAVFARVWEVMPDLAPASLLDIGAGSGAASWAAAENWPGISVTMLDANPHLRALAARL